MKGGCSTDNQQDTEMVSAGCRNTSRCVTTEERGTAGDVRYCPGKCDEIGGREREGRREYYFTVCTRGDNVDDLHACSSGIGVL